MKIQPFKLFGGKSASNRTLSLKRSDYSTSDDGVGTETFGLPKGIQKGDEENKFCDMVVNRPSEANEKVQFVSPVGRGKKARAPPVVEKSRDGEDNILIYSAHRCAHCKHKIRWGELFEAVTKETRKKRFIYHYQCYDIRKTFQELVPKTVETMESLPGNFKATPIPFEIISSPHSDETVEDTSDSELENEEFSSSSPGSSVEGEDESESRSTESDCTLSSEAEVSSTNSPQSSTSSLNTQRKSVDDCPNESLRLESVEYTENQYSMVLSACVSRVCPFCKNKILPKERQFGHTCTGIFMG